MMSEYSNERSREILVSFGGWVFLCEYRTFCDSNGALLHAASDDTKYSLRFSGWRARCFANTVELKTPNGLSMYHRKMLSIITE